MMTTRKNERELILSDAILCAVLKIEADAIGATLEEYVERFLEVVYKEPEKFYSILVKADTDNISNL